MADGSIIIDTQIDTSGAQKGLKSLASSIKTVTKQTESVNKLSSAFDSVKSTVQGVASKLNAAKTSFSAVATAIKAVGAAIDDVTEAYKTQAKAEAQLEQAAKNNPYLDKSSVSSLKRYASALQSVGNVGDEELLPMMARLAASGRTQEEIQSTMAAALDLSASGAMSLDAAVDALNKTYAGTTGQLGRTLPEIAALTDEELAQGKAVDIVAEKYKGMAAAIADTKTQAANAKGDFKEAVGALTAPSVNAWNKFWKGFYEAATDALSKVKQALDALTMSADDKTYVKNMEEAADWTSRNEAELERYLELKKRQLKLSDEEFEALQTVSKGTIDAYQNQISKINQLIALRDIEYQKTNADQALLDYYNQEIEKNKSVIADVSDELMSAIEKGGDYIDSIQGATNALNEQREAAKQAAEAQAEAQEAAQAQADLESQLAAFNKEYEDAIEATKRNIETRRQMGEVISDEAEQEELLNAKTQAYLKLAENYAGVGQKLSDENRYLQDVVATTQQLATAAASVEFEQMLGELTEAKYQEALKSISDTVGDIADRADDMLATVSDDKLSVAIESAIALLETQREQYADNEKAAAAYTEQIEQLKELLPQVTTAEARGEIEAFRDTLATEGEASLSVYEQLLQQKQQLADEYNQLIKSDAVTQAGYTQEEIYAIEQEYAAKVVELNNQIAKAEEERAKELATNIATYTEKTAAIIQDACSTMIDAIEDEADAEKEILADKYEQGLISQEEYEAGIEAIEEAAAMKEYKIELANWTAQLAEAAASVALGCARSLESGMPQGAILAALTAAAGAVQIAAITASKPTKPTFAEGGIVPGTSYSGDNVEARVNSGEMVLTKDQQANLFNMANGMIDAQRLTSYPITINNTQSDKVRASARADSQGVTIDIVDGFVQHRIASGAYDGSFRSYEGVRSGRRLL